MGNPPVSSADRRSKKSEKEPLCSRLEKRDKHLRLALKHIEEAEDYTDGGINPNLSAELKSARNDIRDFIEE